MRKYLLIVVIILSVISTTYAQNFDKPAVEITPAVLAKLKLDVEKEIPAFKESNKKWKRGPIGSEFSVDTFRIERLTDKWIKIDYTDAGMSQATYNQAKEYDVLLNKYYKKLLSILNPEEKKKLIAAEKSWLSFRDNEVNLMEAVNDKAYVGGTIEGLTNSGEYLKLIQTRTKDLYSYYVRCMHEE
jgi:uncharacterized protein YecT (DUF1311 family)